MMPNKISVFNSSASLIVSNEKVQYYLHDVEYSDYLTGAGRWKSGNIYDNIIDCIGWLIIEGYFNKEYLEEKIMIHISDDIYRRIAKFLREQGSYWSGRIIADGWVFNASIVIYDNDIVPVWYEFLTDYPDNQNNDFSFDKLKEFYKR